ncbi:MAG: hypothetical protein QM503_10150 [Bacteroidota bacterium]
MINRDYYINNNKIEIDNNCIKYNFITIKWEDVNDFDFRHEYFNGNGGADLIIKTINSRIGINVTRTIFSVKSKSREIDLLNKLFIEILPFLNVGYLQHSIKMINNYGKIKVANLQFSKYFVSIRPRRNLWINKIDITYDNAVILIENLKIGFVGGAGNSNFLTLVDTQNNKEYRYSRSANYQSSIGDNIKAKNLLTYIKENGT